MYAVVTLKQFPLNLNSPLMLLNIYLISVYLFTLRIYMPNSIDRIYEAYGARDSVAIFYILGVWKSRSLSKNLGIWESGLLVT